MTKPLRAALRAYPVPAVQARTQMAARTGRSIARDTARPKPSSCWGAAVLPSSLGVLKLATRVQINDDGQFCAFCWSFHGTSRTLAFSCRAIFVNSRGDATVLATAAR